MIRLAYLHAADAHLVKFSPDRSLAAIQRSHRELEILRVRESREFLCRCKDTKGSENAILDAAWLPFEPPQLVLMTMAGVEQHRLSPDAEALQLVALHKLSDIRWYSYADKLRVCLYARVCRRAPLRVASSSEHVSFIHTLSLTLCRRRRAHKGTS